MLFRRGLSRLADNASRIFDAGGTAGRNVHATLGRKAFLGAARDPGLVLGDGEALVDLVHGHQLLLAPAAVLPRHVREVDGVAVLIVAGAIA